MHYHSLLFLKTCTLARILLAADYRKPTGRVEVQMSLRAVLDPDCNATGIPFSIFLQATRPPVALRKGGLFFSLSLMLNRKILGKDSDWSF